MTCNKLENSLVDGGHLQEGGHFLDQELPVGGQVSDEMQETLDALRVTVIM